ncbi:MAG: glycosyltransferase family 4 protein, partial [Gemmatimonadota bacterium]
RATPLVVSFCGSDLLGLEDSGVRCRARNALTRTAGLVAATRARAVTVKSGNLRQALPPFLRRKARVVPNGVDTDLFVPMPVESCRSRLGWPQESRIVLFDAGRGRGRATKNIELAQAAISSLRERQPDVELEVISDTSRDDVVLMLNAADCLLVTSLHEGSPNIVKEAMACNLPVVSVPCGDVEERLEGASVGGVCARDAAGLARGIESALAAGARSNGREELLRQGMTVQSIRDRLLEVYASVVDHANGKATPGGWRD